jgi:hypothetical protein
VTGTILKGLNEHTIFLLGHLILVPSECEGVLPLDHDIQFLTPYASYTRELTEKIHVPINTKREGQKKKNGNEEQQQFQSLQAYDRKCCSNIK